MSLRSHTSTRQPGSRAIPRLTTPMAISDGGLETTLVFHAGLDLPDFAAFPLLDSEQGREALAAYYEPYLAIAERDSVALVLDTPTWRANADWGQRLGYDRERLDANNRDAVAFVRSLVAGRSIDAVVNGVIGPRGDGYVIGELMTADESASYHALQTRAFAAAGADMVSAVTMTYVDQAIGIVRAAVAADLPVVISFTVETDGRLPSGQPLGEAIEATDAATDGAAAWFMVNCAHPTHFERTLTPDAPWLSRVQAIRANASRMSHAELDAAEELDRGNPAELADHYRALKAVLPQLRVVGGCCGTDHEHVAAISAALSATSVA